MRYGIGFAGEFRSDVRGIRVAPPWRRLASGV